jgi:ATP-dependent protease HslVU (ClpYQ) peptidase subunit
MTTIAAVQGSGFAVIGYDSRISGEGGRLYVLPKNSPKVIKNGSYLLGAAGDLRAVNLLATISLPEPAEKMNAVELDRFVSTQIIPVIKNWFEENGYGKDGEQQSELMLCVRGVLYELSENYDCTRDANGIYGIGSGSSYAVGALHAMVDKNTTVDEAKDCMREALRIAMKLDSGSGLPTYVVVQYADE